MQHAALLSLAARYQPCNNPKRFTQTSWARQFTLEQLSVAPPNRLRVIRVLDPDPVR
jgi:hypothetical protein